MAAYSAARPPPPSIRPGVGELKDPSSFVDLQERSLSCPLTAFETLTQQRLGKCLRFDGFESHHLFSTTSKSSLKTRTSGSRWTSFVRFASLSSMFWNWENGPALTWVRNSTQGDSNHAAPSALCNACLEEDPGSIETLLCEDTVRSGF